MKQPTSKEIEEAKDYLRQRLNAELSMKNNLLAIMYQAAKEIIAVSYKYNVPTNQFSFSYNKELQEEVETIIANLRELIEDYTETLAVATHTDEKEHIISFINRESHGKTLVDRINEYTTQFKKELEVDIASGVLLNVAEGELLSSIKESRKNPLFNRHIRQATSQGFPVISRLKVPETYGVGRTNSSFTALDNLTNFAIAEGWMDYFAMIAKKSGAIGFMSFRGSSYPCQQCDDETTYFHAFSNGDPVPPYHAHCCCYIVPIYEIDI
ncbi:hypothetical protein [Bacteroides cellulosilyticus]|uniref:hypothetical protein n=1 Tax=Bacteroides cellulosilyticus TaxID=246787 RepID=UPI00189DC523|nr:hypothetical protein [Bacteroides cellulosilyticus]